MLKLVKYTGKIFKIIYKFGEGYTPLYTSFLKGATTPPTIFVL